MRRAVLFFLCSGAKNILDNKPQFIILLRCIFHHFGKYAKTKRRIYLYDHAGGNGDPD